MKIQAEICTVVAPTIAAMQTLSNAPGQLQVNGTSSVAALIVSS
jgi:hypothetical protein